jgi:subtilase family serine protease
MRLFIIGGLLLTTIIQAAAAAPDPLTVQTDLPRTEQRIGATDPGKTLTLAIPLKVKNPKALDAALADLYDPTSPNFHHFLSPAAFTSQFVDTSARQQVADHLRSERLAVHDSGTGTVIGATGNVATVERAFNVTLSDYKDASGHIFSTSNKTPALPSSVAAHVQGILGLNTAVVDTPHFIVAPVQGVSPVPTHATSNDAPALVGAAGCPDAVAASYHLNQAYTPNQIASWYGFGSFSRSGVNGENQTVALFEEDDYRDANVQAYAGCFGDNATVARIPVDGGTTPGSGEIEVELDIDILLGMAPRLGQVLVYESANNDAAAIDQYQRIANDDAAQVVSTSWGTCEQNRTGARLNAEYAIFQQMAAQGQSMFAAAGDNGSQDCGTDTLAVDDPASQPYVTGVGGTKLDLGCSPCGPIFEYSAWNDGINSYGAGGGGLSAIWAKPSYQTGPGTTNSYSNGMRQVPDVSASADPIYGYLVFVHDATNCPIATKSGATDCFLSIGGTSASAPLWASIALLTNQYLAVRGQPRLGFMNPPLYRLLAGNQVFPDVTEGGNCREYSCNGVYPATYFYDQATGIGPPRLADFLTGVVSPAPRITRINPSDNLSGNGAYTVYGANFGTDPVVKIGGNAVFTSGVTDTTMVISPVEVPPSGVYDVTVQTKSGSATLTGALTYYPPNTPLITGSSVPNGSVDGGDIVTLFGKNLQGGALAILFDGLAATIVAPGTGDQVTVSTPPHAVGNVDITATSFGLSTTLPHAFRYQLRPGPILPGAVPAPQPGGRPAAPSSPNGSPNPAPPPRLP